MGAVSYYRSSLPLVLVTGNVDREIFIEPRKLITQIYLAMDSTIFTLARVALLNFYACFPWQMW